MNKLLGSISLGEGKEEEGVGSTTYSCHWWQRWVVNRNRKRKEEEKTKVLQKNNKEEKEKLTRGMGRLYVAFWGMTFYLWKMRNTTNCAKQNSSLGTGER